MNADTIRIRDDEVKSKLAKISTVAVVILVSCSFANGQDKRIDLTAGNIEISLVLPANLQPFSEQRMDLVREYGIAAKFIFSDSQGDLIAAINTFGSGADETGLARVGDQIKAGAEKQGAYAGELTRDLITMNGKKWLRLSFKEASRGVELINDYYVTDWSGEYVLINFSSPVAKYESYKGAVERSARSVQLGMIAETIKLNHDGKRAPKMVAP
jgi:hypothetical protein